jgi:HEPN domain-containing protein
MWVAIATFDDYEGIETYKSNANDHDKNVTNSRTDKDIQTAVKNIIVKMGYEPTVKKITELLKKQKVKPSDMNDFVKTVGKMLDVNTNTIQSYSTGKAKSTALTMMNNENYVTQMFKNTNGNDIQYDMRSIFAAIEKKIEADDPSLPVSIVAYWSHQNEEGLLKARSVKQSIIDKKVHKILKMAKMIVSPDYTPIKVVNLPQTQEEVKNNVV